MLFLAESRKLEQTEEAAKNQPECAKHPGFPATLTEAGTYETIIVFDCGNCGQLVDLRSRLCDSNGEPR